MAATDLRLEFKQAENPTAEVRASALFAELFGGGIQGKIWIVPISLNLTTLVT